MAGALLITCVILSAIYTFLTSQEGFICFPLPRGGEHAAGPGHCQPHGPALILVTNHTFFQKKNTL